MENITDKELLAICNLSNLKMEFANLIEKEETRIIERNRKKETVKILTNHTIYSLLEKEVLGQEKRLEVAKGNKKFFKGNNLPHYSPLNLKTGKYLDEEEAKLIKENKGKLGVFYREKTVNSRSNWFYDKTSLRKAAPLIMEYFDRYKESKKNKNHEGTFLEEWEVIYGGDFYEMLLDYHILNKANIDNKNKETSNRIKTQTEKYDFKFTENFPFREDIISEKKNIQRINVYFDIITSLLPADEFTSYVNKNFTKSMVIKCLNF